MKRQKKDYFRKNDLSVVVIFWASIFHTSPRESCNLWDQCHHQVLGYSRRGYSSKIFHQISWWQNIQKWSFLHDFCERLSYWNSLNQKALSLADQFLVRYLCVFVMLFSPINWKLLTFEFPWIFVGVFLLIFGEKAADLPKLCRDGFRLN